MWRRQKAQRLLWQIAYKTRKKFMEIILETKKLAFILFSKSEIETQNI